MDCLIRNAVMEDYKAVLEMMNQVQQMHVSWRSDIYKPNTHMISVDTFSKFIEEDTLYVAEANGKVIGIMKIEYHHIETPVHITKNMIYIDTMAVDEKYRGHGVGHKFFETVKVIKMEKGFDGIELQVNAKNKSAYEMYLKCGFTEKSVNMEL